MHVVATAGHVDHGKSTLLRALTGMEPDRWEAERERGLTIDLGFVWCDLADDLTVAFVDVPGHERFIANMLAGAGAVRLALFVVAADDGWSAQSQEHLEILDVLGVSAAVVAVTKSGPAGSERTAEVVADVARRLRGTALVGAPILAVDSVSGAGLDDLRQVLADRLRALPPETDRGRPRLWVDRSFTVTGAGTVVTGTLTGGRLEVGQELLVLPSGARCRVRGLQSLGRPVREMPPGSRVAVNVAGIDRDDVVRGDALVGAWTGDRPAATRDVGEVWRATRQLDVWLVAVADAGIGRRGAWHLHAGSAQTTVAVHPLLHAPAAPDAPAYARLVLDRPLPLTAGDRFVLREAGRQATLGGGTVLDPDPPSRPRGTDARLRRASELDTIRDADDEACLPALLAAAGGARPSARARAAAGAAPDERPAGVTELVGHLCLDDALARWVDAVMSAAAAAGVAGAPRAALGQAARAVGCPPALARRLPDELVSRGELVQRGSVAVVPSHAQVVDEDRRRRAAELLARLDSLTPPPLSEAARSAGLGHEEVNALVQAGDVVVCGDVAFARSAVERATERLRSLPAPFTTSEARAVLDTTRKYAIPLLEHLDATGVTVFDGTARRLRSEPSPTSSRPPAG